MRNLSPETRRKLAIMLKSKEASSGMPIQGAAAPGLAPPPQPSMGPPMAKPFGAPSMAPAPSPMGMQRPQKPLFSQSASELNPKFFNLKKKLKGLS